MNGTSVLTVNETVFTGSSDNDDGLRSDNMFQLENEEMRREGWFL